MDEKFGYHGYFRSEPDVGNLYARIDAAARASGFVLAGTPERDGTDRLYAKGDLPPINIALDLGKTWSQMLIANVSQSTFESYGVGAIRRLVSALSEGTALHLGRSSQTGGASLVVEAELDGSIDSVDWLQYYGPRIARRWSHETLTSGPFHDVE